MLLLQVSTSQSSWQKGKAKTVLVEGELLQHLEVTDDLGAKGDETGKVKLTIRPIESSGQFGAVLATREVSGDVQSRFSLWRNHNHRWMLSGEQC
jgi:hypothetical protein